MRGIKLVLVISFCVLAFAQSGTIMSGSGSKDNVSFSYETRLEPPAPPLADGIGGGVVTGKSGLHRYLVDHIRRMYFGYDLMIESLQQTNRFIVTIRQITIGPEKMQLGDPAAWTMLPLPAYPAPQMVQGGDEIVLDILTNPTTGQRIVDHLRIQNRGSAVPAVGGIPRDFSVNDAELQIKEPQVTINGQIQGTTATAYGSTVSGPVVWFYLRGRGRYFLSLVPRAEIGFRKAGEVRGRSLAFTVEGDVFTLNCGNRVAPGSAPYNLYVLRDTAWRPSGEDSSVPLLLGSGGGGVARAGHR
jgi:hypothetical protein